ncbi:polymerase, partial [Pedobacter sp. HMWF019]
ALYKMFSLKYSKSINTYSIKVVFFVLLLVLISPYIYQYVTSTIEMKSDESLNLRGDQVNVLIDNLSESQFTLLLGQGLGHTLKVITPLRDYTDSIYFEIQTLYILNQLGIFFFLCFIIYNILIMMLKWGWDNQEIYLAYFIYIVYAVTNPYIFDTNHVVIIIVLNSWVYIKKKRIEEGNRINSNTI